MRHEEPDRVPVSDFFWGSFLERWRKDLDLPAGTDIYTYYDLDWIVTVPNMAPHIKQFEILKENEEEVSVLGMVIIYVAMNVPFTAWLMDGFFRAIPQELDEAAIVDGCSRWGAFLRVDLPLSLPGAAASGIFTFLTSWR